MLDRTDFEDVLGDRVCIEMTLLLLGFLLGGCAFVQRINDSPALSWIAASQQFRLAVLQHNDLDNGMVQHIHHTIKVFKG